MQQEDVFQAYKPLLFSIAYHMLGSVMDAEDCVQEAYARAWTAFEASAQAPDPQVNTPRS